MTRFKPASRKAHKLTKKSLFGLFYVAVLCVLESLSERSERVRSYFDVDKCS
jgi:hypothetical protein